MKGKIKYRLAGDATENEICVSEWWNSIAFICLSHVAFVMIVDFYCGFKVYNSMFMFVVDQWMCFRVYIVYM